MACGYSITFRKILRAFEAYDLSPLEFVSISLPAAISGVPVSLLNSTYFNGIIKRGPYFSKVPSRYNGIFSEKNRVRVEGPHWQAFKRFVETNYSHPTNRSVFAPTIISCPYPPYKRARCSAIERKK